MWVGEGINKASDQRIEEEAWIPLNFVLGLSWKWMAWQQLSLHPLWGPRQLQGARRPIKGQERG